MGIKKAASFCLISDPAEKEAAFGDSNHVTSTSGLVS
jgi:hypothetical protein